MWDLETPEQESLESCRRPVHVIVTVIVARVSWRSQLLYNILPGHDRPNVPIGMFEFSRFGQINNLLANEFGAQETDQCDDQEQPFLTVALHSRQSALSASIGSSLAARHAGQSPLMMPTTDDTVTPIMAELMLRSNGK